MSYLGLPRLHFSGKFIAQPSTVNNTLTNYAASGPVAPLFNADGGGRWDFQDCTVTQVAYEDGTVATAASADPLIGAPVSGNSGAPAKIVDLDPDQQLVSELWGLQMTIGGAASGSATGSYRVSAFSDLWPRTSAPGQGDTSLAAYWQSVIEKLTWSAGPPSRFLAELAAASPDAISIKFNCDSFSLDTLVGRITGTIGPAAADEPSTCVLGRHLMVRRQTMSPDPTLGNSPMYHGVASVDDDRGKVVVDLGNSIRTGAGGTLDSQGLGAIQLAVDVPGQGFELLGAIDYQAAGWYEHTAGVAEVPAAGKLTTAQLSRIATSPLAIVQVDGGGNVTAAPLAETSTGAYVCADGYVFRMNAGDSATVELYCTRFGKPESGQTVDLGYEPRRLIGAQGVARFPVGTPHQALGFPPRTTQPTDASGRTSFPLTAGDPGNPRQIIDGQVYAVAYSWDEQAAGDRAEDFWNFVSVLVHTLSVFEPPITWWSAVEPILAQYAKLYPVMKKTFQIDLADYDSVFAHRDAIAHFMQLDFHDPSYMPVTRDLSLSKLRMIVDWIAAGAPEGTKT